MIPRPRTGRKQKYNFTTLEVGERKEIKKQDKASATQCAYKHGRDNNKAFAVRDLEEGVFIYRTK